MLFLAWRYGKGDIYQLYNGLDDDYRPLANPDWEPRPPLYPSRLRYFTYGCGLWAMEIESRLAGAKQSGRATRAMGG